VLSTVEASLRLDAVASAGFGVSRSRMADWIRQGVGADQLEGGAQPQPGTG